MRKHLITISLILLSAIIPSLFAAPENKSRPNIVIFLSDDHGQADSGVYGDSYIRTPHIDQLAAEGMRFTLAFAASPLCSPSRCVIETGLMPHRNGGHKFGTPIIKGIKTMPAYFKELGYFTAHIGKFHHSPRKQFPYDFVNGDENRAAAFISNYNKTKPLFLMVCSHPPHTPWIKNTTYDPAKTVLPPNFIDTPQTRSDRANYYSDVTLMDSILGSVLNALDKKGISDNTLFIYTSDQGANWPFAKWCVYDGGLMVPFIARWSGIIRAGSVSDSMISLVDILPTCIDASGNNPPSDIDGLSLLPVLKDPRQEHRKVLFGTHTGNDNGGPGIANHCPARTIRTPTYRYILNLSPETLFTTHITGCKSGKHYLPHWDSWVEKAKSDSLKKDPFEMHNLADNPEQQQIMNSLRKQLAEWRKSQGETITE